MEQGSIISKAADVDMIDRYRETVGYLVRCTRIGDLLLRFIEIHL